MDPRVRKADPVPFSLLEKMNNRFIAGNMSVKLKDHFNEFV